MSQGSLYLLAADAILVIHGAFVAFVIIGLVLIYVGHGMTWHWIRNRWFRLLHVGAIAVVVLQSWLGVICPLTLWEMRLRELGGRRHLPGYLHPVLAPYPAVL